MRLVGKAHIVEPLKELIAQDHSRARDHLQVGQIRHFSRCDAILPHLAHPSRARAQHRDLLLAHHPNERREIRLEWRPVVQNNTRSGQQVHER